ncbi:XRE family transcriptional regulator [Rhizobium sp. LjRoot258]|uniref:XRE family transcriptional regulator n=1 Tax=Rhizobium sp. LjRoot258 TaxID=3342299 RepID=UPI003ECF5A7B
MFIKMKKDKKRLHCGFLDIFFVRRFFGCMNVILPADILRVARALTGLPQLVVAKEADLAVKTVTRAESGNLTAQVSHKLRAFYEGRGIEFLGSVDISTGRASGAGARWRMPESIPPTEADAAVFHTESYGVSFAAARGMLGGTQKDICVRARLPEKTVIALERAAGYSDSEFQRLRTYYEGCGIEFLAWGDVSRKAYYGVGVRWAGQGPGGLEAVASNGSAP